MANPDCFINQYYVSFTDSASEILLKYILGYLFLGYLLIVLCLFYHKKKALISKDKNSKFIFASLLETVLGMKPAKTFTPGL